MDRIFILVLSTILTGIIVGAVAILLALGFTSKGEVDLSDIEKANKNLSVFKIFFLGWVVEYDQESTLNYYKYHEKFTWVSPTWYVVDSNGNILEKYFDEYFVNKSKEWGVKVVPLVANEGFNREIVHKILSDPKLREKVAQQLLDLVLERGYDGINIDFENIPPEDRDNLTVFMKILYEMFHKRGKLVSIDVASKTKEVYTGWAGAYDYKELGKYSDLVILMIYDYHWSTGSPGPISPLNWFRSVLEYATQTIPKEKIVAGLPFYGYDWPVGQRAKGLKYSQAIELAKQYGAKVVFDEENGEATFKYLVMGLRHEVWFNIAKSTELRIRIALEYGINKIAAWRIGQEDPLTWNIIERP
ncbi:MAG: hypothetical protein J7L38_06410 [Thermoproteales archaeon]|nr:hypothetical protein [Thermoproteales archaeon]